MAQFLYYYSQTKPIMYSKITFLFLLLALVLQSCSGTKKYAKQAGKFEAAGLYDEAANYYYESLKRDKTNIEAIAGLKKNGEKVFQDYLDDFTELSKKGNNKEAISKYNIAQDYSNKLEKVNIELEIPDYIKSDYEDLKNDYLLKKYNEGKVALGNENFEKALGIFKEVSRLDENYKDVSNLKKIAFVEPYYQDAINSYTEENYIKTYYLLENVYQLDPNYKDTKEIREDCLEKGTYTVAIAGIKDVNGGANGHKIHASLLNNLMNSDNPFIKVIDRENIDFIMNQQKLNLSGAVNEESGANSGELFGIKAVVSGKFLEATMLPGSKKVVKRDGYESYWVEQVNESTKKEEKVKKYAKVNYFEYQQRNEVALSYQIQLTSLETGEIIFSKIVNKGSIDEVKYITYEGNVDNLYAQANGKLTTNRAKKNELNSLSKSKRNITSTNALLNDLMTSSVNSVSTDLLKAIDSYVRK